MKYRENKVKKHKLQEILKKQGQIFADLSENHNQAQKEFKRLETEISDTRTRLARAESTRESLKENWHL